jgi:hypothetical protein
MTCRPCQAARRAAAEAGRALLRGQPADAAAQARTAAAEIAGKLQDEAQRVRAILSRR